MYSDNKIWIAKNNDRQYLLPRMANRHGLICGATGTGKTITLKVLAEAFSDAGVPVFISDIKGDLSGMSLCGEDSENMRSRIERFGLAEAGFTYKAYPTCYWDVFGEKGTPVRASVSEMGPLLMSQILDLNETQAGVLSLAFRIADDEGLLLLDLKDLRALIQYVGERADIYRLSYGQISSASIGAIQRSLLQLEDQGGALFFGEPALDLRDWITCAPDGRGMIHDMNCEKLFLQPRLYAAFLLWLLSELYELLPEIGDPEKPRFVFFFDEAHLLFKNASRQLLEKVELVIRLIRSKGVGIFFVTQNPADVPDTVLAQLGNRIEHALRAYSQSELKALKAAADTFRSNPAFDTAEAILSCGTGEALVQFLDEKGAPRMVERAFILPPQSLMGAAPDEVRSRMILESQTDLKYNRVIDRESAYELLVCRAARQNAAAVQPAAVPFEEEGGSAPEGQSAAGFPGAAASPDAGSSPAAVQNASPEKQVEDAAYEAAYIEYLNSRSKAQAASAAAGAASARADALRQQGLRVTYESRTIMALAAAACRDADEPAGTRESVSRAGAAPSAAASSGGNRTAAEVRAEEAAARKAEKEAAKAAREAAAAEKKKKSGSSILEKAAESAIRSGARSFGSQVGRSVFRGLFGSMK